MSRTGEIFESVPLSNTRLALSGVHRRDRQCGGPGDAADIHVEGVHPNKKKAFNNNYVKHQNQGVGLRYSSKPGSWPRASLKLLHATSSTTYSTRLIMLKWAFPFTLSNTRGTSFLRAQAPIELSRVVNP